jgi:hypothetical protein
MSMANGFPAKFETVCAGCNRRIGLGQLIFMDATSSYRHANCNSPVAPNRPPRKKPTVRRGSHEERERAIRTALYPTTELGDVRVPKSTRLCYLAPDALSRLSQLGMKLHRVGDKTLVYASARSGASLLVVAGLNAQAVEIAIPDRTPAPIPTSTEQHQVQGRKMLEDGLLHASKMARDQHAMAVESVFHRVLEHMDEVPDRRSTGLTSPKRITSVVRGGLPGLGRRR